MQASAKKIKAEEINCDSDDELAQDNIKTSKASPYQKLSKNAAAASREPSTASTVKSTPLFTSCFTVNDDATLTKDNKRRLACVLKKSKKYIERMHHCNKRQMQDHFDKRIARIISNVNISTKKYHSTASLASASSSKFLYEAYKRIMDDQEKLHGGLFESAKQIQIFMHNFGSCDAQKIQLAPDPQDQHNKGSQRHTHQFHVD
eukprot:9658667-Ditylum_brightwellii.AAC.1